MNATKMLCGKTAVITGGTGVIGKAITRALLANGMNVVITGRSAERLQEAREDLLSTLTASTTSGGDSGAPSIEESSVSVHVVGDLCDEKSVSEMYESVHSAYGGADLLINNAGIAVAGSPIDITSEEFMYNLQINVGGPFVCSKHFLLSKHIKEGRGGRIINVGSISAESPRRHTAPYTASKFALAGLTRSLALDARHLNVAVGIIHPGNVWSPIMSEEERLRREREEGFVHPDDLARCVVTMANLPYDTNVLEMTVLPTTQPFVGRG